MIILLQQMTLSLLCDSKGGDNDDGDGDGEEEEKNYCGNGGR